MANNFNERFDTKALSKKVADIQNTAPTSTEVPAGRYECKIDKIDLAATGPNSKNPGTPMCKIQFRIVDGEYANQCLFYNKVLVGYDANGEQTAQPLHFNNVFLKSLKVFDDSEIVFQDFEQYNDLLLDIAEECTRSKLTFDIQYSIKNGFSNFEVKGTHEN